MQSSCSPPQPPPPKAPLKEAWDAVLFKILRPHSVSRCPVHIVNSNVSVCNKKRSGGSSWPCTRNAFTLVWDSLTLVQTHSVWFLFFLQIKHSRFKNCQQIFHTLFCTFWWIKSLHLDVRQTYMTSKTCNNEGKTYKTWVEKDAEMINLQSLSLQRKIQTKQTTDFKTVSNQCAFRRQNQAAHDALLVVKVLQQVSERAT